MAAPKYFCHPRKLNFCWTEFCIMHSAFKLIPVIVETIFVPLEDFIRMLVINIFMEGLCQVNMNKKNRKC